jgi:quercetin dioxygenase-like cupin family protein
MTNASDAERQPPSTRDVQDAAGAAAAVASALAGAPRRLKKVRTQRRMTLSGVAAATGISKSTLSRLETRIRLKPGQVKGRTVIPLSRQPDSMQAWKIVIPTSKVDPEPRAHDGHEWLYVLSGRMRLVLGNKDWVLGPGEVAEFDTQAPHWFGSTGEAPAEILSIFGRPGERMNDRTPEV